MKPTAFKTRGNFPSRLFKYSKYLGTRNALKYNVMHNNNVVNENDAILKLVSMFVSIK